MRIDRRKFLGAAGTGGALLQVRPSAAQPRPAPRQVHPGVWQFRFGAPEAITPVATRHYQPAAAALASLPAVATCPVPVTGTGSQRGYLVRIPLAANQSVYGLGLQLQSLMQRGLKKRLRVNADPKMDTGDSHAPVPFYVTTGGYGVLVDTARYATFYCGNKDRKGVAPPAAEPAPAAIGEDALPAAYRRFHFDQATEVMVEIPEAAGVDVYVFGGPTMRLAVQRYNLFSGGGPLPPRWGLGMWYRVKSDYSQEDVLRLASEFRDRRIPCDVLGLEPGWQTHAYSCTYVWSKKYPEPARLVRDLASQSYRLNLWEHAFTHPDSPIHQALSPHSGDYEVWGGLVPDFLDPEARRIFAGFHEKEHVALGVSGYKLDECDNSDFTGNWSWPEVASFPSGADGEQMHCLFGQRYQDALQSVFEKRKERTYGLVRSSGALAAPYPYVLYSDLYDHKEFIRGVANMGFSGLLWTPELRNASNPEDLIRRLQSVVLSPMALINGWYIKNPPWKQVERAANNADRLAPDWERVEAQCRAVMELRMRLIPYLHAAFVRYRSQGFPPFRALVMDYPNDPETWAVDDQYMVGESMLVAPVVAGQSTRAVYLPAGDWFDFWTGQRSAGKRRIQISPPLEQIPIYVKAGAILPLAEATLHTAGAASLRLHVQVFGNPAAPAVLYEDDGSWNPSLAAVTLSWDSDKQAGSISRSGNGTGPRYEVAGWKLFE
ncbi:MAG: glycoside hydrolase family 31 protein [Candidatus Sulfopaludibacter sp.]|nr:glycoside hydrolase family 31 protein [Candidatus Sulfopaludibacter sp.]